METSVRKLFERYERVFNASLHGDVDMDKVAALYASEFIAASPAGVMTGKNDEQLRQAMAQVTGVQMQIGSHHSPFRVKRPGNIVAFTIRLANPSADQINYFKTTFGAKKTPRDGLTPGGDDAQVRLSVLKPLHTKQRFLLENQSETFDVEQYLGSTVTFALAKALRIHKDRLLALTVPTWVPAFAHSLDTNEAWRASHRSDECTQKNPHPRPHTKMGTFMQYGCFYRTARVLYSATFVPDAAKTSPPAK